MAETSERPSQPQRGAQRRRETPSALMARGVGDHGAAPGARERDEPTHPTARDVEAAREAIQRTYR